MTTVRLPIETEQKLAFLSEVQHTTKSELIKEALELFFARKEIQMDSFELGQPYFGKYGSKLGNLSQDYKQIVKEKIRAKHHSH